MGPAVAAQLPDVAALGPDRVPMGERLGGIGRAHGRTWPWPPVPSRPWTVLLVGSQRIGRPCRHRASREDFVDLATILAGAVALLILISGWILFNGVPKLERQTRERRPARRR
jgi:hypothetical protein